MFPLVSCELYVYTLSRSILSNDGTTGLITKRSASTRPTDHVNKNGGRGAGVAG